MTPVLFTGLSGLKAAEVRFSNSASNVANIRTTNSIDSSGAETNTPFAPLVVQQTSLQSGGVTTSLTPLTPPSFPLYEPDNSSANEQGFVDYPNVDLGQEAVAQIQAKQAYGASIKTIQVGSEMLKSLFDIQG